MTERYIPSRKTCPKCGFEREREDFFRNKAAWDGLQNYCKFCWSEYNQSNRARYQATHRRITVNGKRRWVPVDVHKTPAYPPVNPA